MGGSGDAIIFPGQGSQHDGMRATVARERPDLLKAAIELVGTDPFEHLDEGTRYVQPAVFCTSVACWASIRQHVDPIAFAGHSLGEYAALVAAGAVDVFDALRLVVLRGRLTQEVADRVGGGMLALLGVRLEQAYAIAARQGLTVASDNCPGQIVLSGSHAAIALGQAEAVALGGDARRLAVQGPFHSTQMLPAREPFLTALRSVRFREPSHAAFSCLTAAPFVDVPLQLADSLVSGVRWREVLIELRDLGATRFIEVAPGAVLTKMVRRTLRGAPCLTVEQRPLGAGAYVPLADQRPRLPASVTSAVATSSSTPSDTAKTSHAATDSGRPARTSRPRATT
jgi:acyl transferase domain-containing protein